MSHDCNSAVLIIQPVLTAHVALKYCHCKEPRLQRVMVVVHQAMHSHIEQWESQGSIDSSIESWLWTAQLQECISMMNAVTVKRQSCLFNPWTFTGVDRWSWPYVRLHLWSIKLLPPVDIAGFTWTLMNTHPQQQITAEAHVFYVAVIVANDVLLLFPALVLYVFLMCLLLMLLFSLLIMCCFRFMCCESCLLHP